MSIFSWSFICSCRNCVSFLALTDSTRNVWILGCCSITPALTAAITSSVSAAVWLLGCVYFRQLERCAWLWISMELSVLIVTQPWKYSQPQTLWEQLSAAGITLGWGWCPAEGSVVQPWVQGRMEKRDMFSLRNYKENNVWAFIFPWFCNLERGFPYLPSSCFHFLCLKKVFCCCTFM